jgi:hypothetical protein
MSVLYVCVRTLNMHMYVYCSYNESQNLYLYLKLVISILKIIFELFKYEFFFLVISKNICLGVNYYSN